MIEHKGCCVGWRSVEEIVYVTSTREGQVDVRVAAAALSDRVHVQRGTGRDHDVCCALRRIKQLAEVCNVFSLFFDVFPRCSRNLLAFDGLKGFKQAHTTTHMQEQLRAISDTHSTPNCTQAVAEHRVLNG